MSRRAIISWSVTAVIVAATSGAFAQARSARTLTTPGAFRTFGSSDAVASFRSYSYGLGALQTPTVNPTTDPLRSAIQSRATYNITRPNIGPAPRLERHLMTGMPSAARMYQPVTTPQASANWGRSGAASPGASSRLLKATSSYISSLGGEQDLGIAARVGSVTSLASAGEDQYSTYMNEGEQAFRSGDFQTAMEKFQMANSVDPKDPESLLSLAHTTFAMSRNSYYRASYYLCRTLKYLPELPLVQLEPKGFFPSEEVYNERLERLEEHLEDVPYDNDAFFVLAYFRWFEGDVEGARQALNQAKRGKVADDLLEAIETFSDGMQARGETGKDDKDTTPPPAEAPTSQPAPAPPQPDEATASTS